MIKFKFFNSIFIIQLNLSSFSLSLSFCRTQSNIPYMHGEHVYRLYIACECLLCVYVVFNFVSGGRARVYVCVFM